MFIVIIENVFIDSKCPKNIRIKFKRTMAAPCMSAIQQRLSEPTTGLLCAPCLAMTIGGIEADVHSGVMNTSMESIELCQHVTVLEHAQSGTAVSMLCFCVKPRRLFLC